MKFIHVLISIVLAGFGEGESDNLQPAATDTLASINKATKTAEQSTNSPATPPPAKLVIAWPAYTFPKYDGVSTLDHKGLDIF